MYLELSILDDNEDEKIESVQRGSRRRQTRYRGETREQIDYYEQPELRRQREARNQRDLTETIESKEQRNFNKSIESKEQRNFSKSTEAKEQIDFSEPIEPLKINEEQPTPPNLKVSDDVFQTLHTMSKFLTQPDNTLSNESELKNEVESVLNVKDGFKPEISFTEQSTLNVKDSPAQTSLTDTEQTVLNMKDDSRQETSITGQIEDLVERDSIKEKEASQLEEIIKEKEKLLAEMQNLERLIKEKESLLSQELKKEENQIIAVAKPQQIKKEGEIPQPTQKTTPTKRESKLLHPTKKETPFLQTTTKDNRLFHTTKGEGFNRKDNAIIQTFTESNTNSQTTDKEENLVGNIRITIKTEKSVVEEFQLPTEQMEDLIEQDLARDPNSLLNQGLKKNTNSLIEHGTKINQDYLIEESLGSNGVTATDYDLNENSQMSLNEQTITLREQEITDNGITLREQTFEQMSFPLKQQVPEKNTIETTGFINESTTSPILEAKTSQNLNQDIENLMEEVQNVDKIDTIQNTDKAIDEPQTRNTTTASSQGTELQAPSEDTVAENSQKTASPIQTKDTVTESSQKTVPQEETLKSVHEIYTQITATRKSKAQIEAIVNDALETSHLEEALDEIFMESARLDDYAEDNELDQAEIDQIFNSYFNDREPSPIYADITLEDLKAHIDKQIQLIQEY